ncbi:MAG: metallophosphoesterase [Bacteroidota bacterium]
MKRLSKFLGLMILPGWACAHLFAQENFRVWPYLQHPASDAMSIIWFSGSELPGTVECREQGTQGIRTIESLPVLADSLSYTFWEDNTFFGGEAPPPPYKHHIRIADLKAGTMYDYRVIQGSDTFSSFFRTAPDGNESIRFVVYGDSETEPESTGKYTSWPDPVSGTSRLYLVDQTTGYSNNLEVIRSRDPDLVLIAGDLTQHGGEQRDWDEFWVHNTDSSGTLSLAAQVPIMPAPGNHEYYEGNYLDGYNQPGSERALNRYLTYFDLPPNQSPEPEQEGRYYHLRYGPVSIISLDLCNNGINGSDEDTNFYLLGEGDPGGGNAPDFGMGSIQYNWLEKQLREAQQNSLFTFVMFHHIPYSSGPHGFPPGVGDLLDNQSGVPTRGLNPLFLSYGVDAVFCGHDEMWERSEISGKEILPDSTEVSYKLPFYDVGVGGDGLRGPVEGSNNENQVFLVHTDAPELWEEGILVEGGKHYGHLEVDVLPVDDHTWNAILTPVYVLPLYNEEDSAYGGFERRVYDDQLILTHTIPDTTLGIREQLVPLTVPRAYPNPFHTHTDIEYMLAESEHVRVSIWDSRGQLVRMLLDSECLAGSHLIPWNGLNQSGSRVSPGLYLYRMETGSGKTHSGKMIYTGKAD